MHGVRRRQDPPGQASPILGLDHVQVAAPPDSEDGARRFYGNLLGLREVEKPADLRIRGGVWFACGNQELHVGVARAFVPAKKAHPALLVTSSSIDALAGRLANEGFEIQWDDVIPRRRRFYTADPWGNRVEFTTAELESPAPE